MQHDIFNTPNNVELTFTDEPTPESYARYPDGRDLGETMPMWRVQTEGYITHEGQLVGVVSRDDGFLDSPDTEWISGGVNSKGPKAVALGRHGNFFHWGFAASPTYLTDEAKDVFVNALHYIARFDGQAPIARKPSGTMLRSSVNSAIQGMSDAGYAETVALYEGFQAEDKARKDELRKRADAGEELTQMELRTLEMAPTQIPGRMRGALRILSQETVDGLDSDPERVSAHLRAIKPFLRPAGWYELEVDEDLKELGIGNADPRMLSQAIALLSTDDEAVGRRVLERYTGLEFDKAAEWGSWLDSNQSRLFFTEAGGFKWLVNTIGEASKTSTRHSKQRPTEPSTEVKATSRAPLAYELRVKPMGEGRYAVSFEVDILNGWHAYAFVPPSSPYTPFRVELELPDGVTLDSKWTKPRSHPSLESPELALLEGHFTMSCEVVVAGSARALDLACSVKYQVCDERMCLPPTSKRVFVSLTK